jgi:protein TonB
MGSIAVFTPLQSHQGISSGTAPKGRPLPLLVSLGLHGVLIALLLVWIVPHQQGAPLPKKGFTVISLAPAVPLPSMQPSQPPPSPPHQHRPTARKLAKASPTWKTPPAPTQMPPPSPAQVAAAPAPPDPTPTTESAPAVITTAPPDPAAAPTASGSSTSEYARTPLAYLMEVSRIIAFNLISPQERQRHGMMVAIVHIRIDRDGTVIGAGVTQSTGIQVLDQEALAVINRIHKFPEPPGEFFPFAIDQPIRFKPA